jgi:CAAX prenyl protease-like protein
MLDRQALIRVIPFAIFVFALVLEDLAETWLVGRIDARWIYVVKTGLVAAALLVLFRRYEELQALPGNRLWLWLGAPAIGILVFVLWINLDLEWLKLGNVSGFDPRHAASDEINWRLAATRLIGAVLVIPIMEEIFWRSYLMRWIDRTGFLALAPEAVSIKAVLISSLMFGIAHSLWFAGFIAGLAYAWLYRASGSIWTSILAHAITNAMLGIWVLQTGSWQFW